MKSTKDLTSAAWGICQAAVRASEAAAVLRERHDGMVDAILAEGDGPTLRGVAFINRPYLKFMRPLEIVWRNGKRMIKAQLVKFGVWEHPAGPDGKLIFNAKWAERVIDNFKRGVYGQKIFADSRHEPDLGSLGELEDMEIAIGDGLNGYFEPTKAGLSAVEEKRFNYASIDFDFDHQSKLISIAASEIERPLESINEVEQVFAILSEQEVEDMPNHQDPTLAASPDSAVLEEVQEQLEELKALKDTLEQQGENLETQQAQLGEEHAALLRERQEFAAERAEQREALRRRKVEVFLTELAQPDKDGNSLAGAVLNIAEQVLLNDPVGEGDGAIQLSEDAGVAGVHAYYRAALEALLVEVPRTVPGKRQIEPQDDRPSDNGKVEKARAARLEELVELRRYTAREEGIELTEELEAKFEVWANEKADREFGPVVEVE